MEVNCVKCSVKSWCTVSYIGFKLSWTLYVFLQCVLHYC